MAVKKYSVHKKLFQFLFFQAFLSLLKRVLKFYFQLYMSLVDDNVQSMAKASIIFLFFFCFFEGSCYYVNDT